MLNTVQKNYRVTVENQKTPCDTKKIRCNHSRLRRGGLFAAVASRTVVSVTMSSSPFHGIFSAFTQAQEEERAPQKMALPAESAMVSLPQAEAAIPAKADANTGRVAVDIYEYDDYYIIKSALAGVRMSDLDIEVDGNILTLRGERRQTDDIPQNQYYLQECYWGPFSRSVTLPAAIDARKVRATFNKDCILKILVPKEDRVKIVRINEA